MRYKKFNQSGLSHYVLPLVVLVLISLIGAKVLSAHSSATLNTSPASKADTVLPIKHEMVLDTTNFSGANTAQSTVAYDYIGTQTVAVLGPGDSMSLVQGVKGRYTACYEVYVQQPKTGSSTISAEFGGYNNSLTTNLTSSTSNALQRVCVPAGTSTNPGFAVKNLNSPQGNEDLEVYRVTLLY